LRKYLVCTANEGDRYVAGVNLWKLQPQNRQLAWPKAGGVGQPAVFLIGKEGYFVTLEWPQAGLTWQDGELRFSYRPGYLLTNSESREVAAGAMGFFVTRGASRDEQLEDARHAFFDYVTDRVKPTVPFPVKFTTWGPWLGQMREDRVLEVMDDLAYVGIDLLHLDAGWQEPDHPYSQKLPRVRDASPEVWDREMTNDKRLPHGLLPIVRAAQARGMKISLWFDACGNAYVREGEEWAIRDRQGKPVRRPYWEDRTTTAPVQSLASAYGDRLREFVLQCLERYDLGGVMFDDNGYTPDFATDRRSLASGWNATDVQMRQILEILDEAKRRRPGIFRFYCRASSYPWVLLHANHIHAGDPGTSEQMRQATKTDYPARAMAFERRVAWRQFYNNFVPPWGIKGDIAGWSVQQNSAIPLNLKYTDQVIASGEGWVQNLFTCFATTAVRDIRFSFRQMPAFDRAILKEWLAWDRRHTRFIFNCRPVLTAGADPNAGIDGYSHVGNGSGVIYLFNRSFATAAVRLKLDETTGFRPADTNLSAYLVYPLKAPLASSKLAYGETLQLPLIGKDCAVIEVGLEKPATLAPYAEYEQATTFVRRQYNTLFLAPAKDLWKTLRSGPVRIEVGNDPRDERLANQILDTLGAGIGRRIDLQEARDLPATRAKCRLIIGTFDGLKDHREIGGRFRDVLYNRFLDWGGNLISAPLVAELPGGGPCTFCLIAPRPEQLARLATDLTEGILDGATQVVAADSPDEISQSVRLKGEVPRERPVLRFCPVVGKYRNLPLPGGLEAIRFQIEAESEDRRSVVWRCEFPPMPGKAPWWEDWVVSVADFAGQDVTFCLTAQQIDGQDHPRLPIGYREVALLGLK